MLFAVLGSVRIEQNCDVGRSFLLDVSPSQQITYIS